MPFLIKHKQLIVLIGVALLFFFLGNNWVALTDPDEVFYSLTAKEMVLRQEWLTPYIFGFPQFEKPIFTYWTLILAFKTWGFTPWAARFFPALFGVFAVIGVYYLALLMYRDKQRAFFAGLVLATSAIFVGMGKTVFTDMIFATFILYAILSFYIAFALPHFRNFAFIAFYVFGALATLTKGPLGLLIPELTAVLFLLYRRRLDMLATPWVGIGFLLAVAIALPWYWHMYQLYGNAFIHEFFYNDHWRRVIEAEHRSNDRWYFYPLSMVGGLFPFSLFLLQGIKDMYKRFSANTSEADHLILSWLLVVFIIFQCAHSKLVSYILPLFPALALLAADTIARRISTVILIIKAGFLILLGIAIMFVPNIVSHKYDIPMLPVYWLSAALITIGGMVYSCAISGRERIGIYILSSVVMVVLTGAWFAKSTVEDNASCAPVAAYLPSTITPGTRVLTSKPYARGVTYYTGHQVAVFDPGGKGYFSPHPIPSFSNDDQLSIFLSSQPLTYAYVKRSGYEHLINNYKDKYNITVIKAFGTNRLLKIERMANT